MERCQVLSEKMEGNLGRGGQRRLRVHGSAPRVQPSTPSHGSGITYVRGWDLLGNNLSAPPCGALRLCQIPEAEAEPRGAQDPPLEDA